MEITTSLQDGVSIIGVSGSFDSSTAQQAEQHILPLIAPQCCLVLDLSSCNYISSAGLRVLLFTAKQLAAKNGKWAFAGLSEEIKDVMDMTGFSGFFTTCATVEEAVVKVKEK